MATSGSSGAGGISAEYAQILKQKPFGWTFDEPPTLHSWPFEQIDLFYWHRVIESNWHLSYSAIALYLVSVFGLQRWMEGRRAFQLKGPLFLWNFTLGLFSLIGFTRTWPELWQVVRQPHGFYNSVCVKEGMNVRSVYWGLLFALSKFWELGDTLFIVLRKRPLVFLQWYHHLVTLWVVWSVAPLVEPITRWYGVLNYGVHSLMYPYFALRTIGVRVPSRVANVITTLQLAQMILGFSVNMASLLYLRSGWECARYPESIRAFNLVYGSFILLFGKLFYDTVLRNGRGRTKTILDEKTK